MSIVDHAEVAQHATSTIVKAAPPVAVIVTGLAGVPWQTIVYVLTALYLTVQIGYGIWKWSRDVRTERKEAPRPTVPPDR